MSEMVQTDEELAEMIAKFRTHPKFSWVGLRDDIVTALKSRRPKWQPIETAPNDGRPILLWLEGVKYHVRVAHWFAAWQNWIDVPFPDPAADEEVWGIGSAVPTHWMPLPSPPESSR